MLKTWQQIREDRVGYVTTDVQEQLYVSKTGPNKWMCSHTFTGAQLYDSTICGAVSSSAAVAAFLDKHGVPRSEFPDWLKEEAGDA